MLVLDISALSLHPTVRQQLQHNGYRSTQDLEGVSLETLIHETNLKPDDAQNILDLVRFNRNQIPLYSASQLLENPSMTISTGCQSIDNILGGGVRSSELTEIIGLPGVGKTQLCMQLCIQVQLQQHQQRDCALYIDADGSLNHFRLQQMIFSRKLNSICSNLMENITTIRTTDHLQLFAACRGLERIIQRSPQIKLVIVDSVAYHLRQKFANNRLQALAVLSQELTKVAIKYDVAIVLTNQVTYREGNRVPALGESWTHVCPTQIAIALNHDMVRMATLLKSSQLPLKSAPFKISLEGVVDV
eukprot:TRINITY_DN10791_c0_g1_i2.p1 TRINITY_DN10791_c0_g1~~TRINITY_DN10791_c0_g1_i2.p1  ORF type:complete len:303 (-),score=33.88 TRINITY_DN10791_c0_g1_i2:272-1180(-)